MTIIAGWPVMTSEWMTEEKVVTRDWWERLTSLPWRPWRGTKVIKVPSTEVLVFDHKLVVHPSMLPTLKERLGTPGTPVEAWHKAAHPDD